MCQSPSLQQTLNHPGPSWCDAVVVVFQLSLIVCRYLTILPLRSSCDVDAAIPSQLRALISQDAPADDAIPRELRALIQQQQSTRYDGQGSGGASPLQLPASSAEKSPAPRLASKGSPSAATLIPHPPPTSGQAPPSIDDVLRRYTKPCGSTRCPQEGCVAQIPKHALTVLIQARQQIDVDMAGAPAHDRRVRQIASLANALASARLLVDEIHHSRGYRLQFLDESKVINVRLCRTALLRLFDVGRRVFDEAITMLESRKLNGEYKPEAFPVLSAADNAAALELVRKTALEQKHSVEKRVKVRPSHQRAHRQRPLISPTRSATEASVRCINS